MHKTLILAVLAGALVMPGHVVAAGCSGADPALSQVVVKDVAQVGGLNEYHLSGTVTNTGTQKQASNVLQFVDIYRDREKMDNIGIPPLKPGQSYTFGWKFQRSQDAGEGTTRLHFRLRMVQPTSMGRQNCNLNNDSSVVTF